MIELNGYLNSEDFRKVIFEKEAVGVSSDTRSKVIESHEFLVSFADDKVIYGVNTGFGPMAQYRVDDSLKNELQLNLIRSHCSGIGEVLPAIYVRATMLARLNTLCLGRSGIHISCVDLLVALLNHDITPIIYAHGGVGASGDLVQLAQLAQVMIGEGQVMYHGEVRATRDVLDETDIAPMSIHLREGLAIMNGTSVMTGIGLVNLIRAEELVKRSCAISCSVNEVMESYDDHYSQGLNRSKLHPGQHTISDWMCQHLKDSGLTKKREHHLYQGHGKVEMFEEKVQEYYSLRCVPQILGPILDTINYAREVLEHELNSTNDNPIVSTEEQQVFHGGNFHGDYVSLEMDKLKLAITKLSMLAERQLNYLMNDKLNGVLPPFINKGTLGLNFGMQGAQFTATSTTAENQMLSTSMYVHSIPNNNDNQDIVSMGTNAALSASRVIENTSEVLAIETIALVQAMSIKSDMSLFSSASRSLYGELSTHASPFVDDYPFTERIAAIKGIILLDQTD